MIYHGTVCLDHILRMDDELAGSMLRDAKTGQRLTSADVKTRATILKAKGYEVWPVFDNHDAAGNCLGHDS